MNARRRQLNHIIALADSLGHVLEEKLDRILDRSLAHDLAVELRRAIERSKDSRLNHVHELACVLESTLERNLMATSSFDGASLLLDEIRVRLLRRTHAPQTLEPCRRLVTLAVTFLPTCHRDRYEEEFRAELADLRPRKQVPHALRLVTRSLVLRLALLDVPAMKSARR